MTAKFDPVAFWNENYSPDVSENDRVRDLAAEAAKQRAIRDATYLRALAATLEMSYKQRIILDCAQAIEKEAGL